MYGYSGCHLGCSRPRVTTMCGEQLSSSFSRGWHRLSRIGPDLISLHAIGTMVDEDTRVMLALRA